MKKILVDTDVLIDFTKGKDKDLFILLQLQSEGKVELYITPVNIAEFVNDKQLKTSAKLQKAKEFLHFFSVSDVTSSIGFLAGEYLREGAVQFLGDALIAATSVSASLHLMTRNRRHFTAVTRLSFYPEAN